MLPVWRHIDVVQAALDRNALAERERLGVDDVDTAPEPRAMPTKMRSPGLATAMLLGWLLSGTLHGPHIRPRWRAAHCLAEFDDRVQRGDPDRRRGFRCRFAAGGSPPFHLLLTSLPPQGLFSFAASPFMFWFICNAGSGSNHSRRAADVIVTPRWFGSEPNRRALVVGRCHARTTSGKVCCE